MSNSKAKNIFILGAGFSKALGAPLQRQILPGLLALDPAQLPLDERDAFIKNRERLIRLLSDSMFIDMAGGTDLIDLENVYTPLDKCIINNYSFRNISLEDVLECRKALDLSLSIYMKHQLDPINTHGTYLSAFADRIVEIKELHPKKDKLSILSTNWDILLDNALYRAIGNKKGLLDYCCNTTPYEKDNVQMPSLFAKAKGHFNIKLLKLHGSLNWLLCPRCGRLFTTFNEKIAVRVYLDHPECRLCEKAYGSRGTKDGGAQLIIQLLMPTYIKDLNNVQLKLIWQNAAIELSEAKRIIFIGYSFPTADFELRQLLARNVPHGASIEVVLKGHPSDEVERRYRSFFGKRAVTFSSEGVEQYL